MTISRAQLRTIARKLLAEPGLRIWDTETTGLQTDAQIIELGIIGANGAELFEQRMRPTVPITKAASAVHGIWEDHLEQSPTFPRVYGDVCTYLQGRRWVCYNAPFDVRMLEQTCEANNLPIIHPIASHCLMEAAKQATGYKRWLKLEKACAIFRADISGIGPAHSALADAKMTRALLVAMAR